MFTAVARDVWFHALDKGIHDRNANYYVQAAEMEKTAEIIKFIPRPRSVRGDERDGRVCRFAATIGIVLDILHVVIAW